MILFLFDITLLVVSIVFLPIESLIRKTPCSRRWQNLQCIHTYQTKTEKVRPSLHIKAQTNNNHQNKHHICIKNPVCKKALDIYYPKKKKIESLLTRNDEDQEIIESQYPNNKNTIRVCIQLHISLPKRLKKLYLKL